MRRAAFLYLGVPAGSALASALSLLLPPAGLFLLPFSAVRSARALFLAPGAASAFISAALAVPIAILCGALAAPSGLFLVPSLTLAFVTLPALGIWVAAREARRRDEILLVVASLTGVGLLSLHLGISAAEGMDAGTVASRRLGGLLPDLLKAYRDSGLAESTVASLAQGFDLVRRSLETQLPGILLALAVLYAGAVVYLFGGGRLRADGKGPEAFSAFRTSVAATVAFVPLGLVAVISGGEARHAAVDLLLPLAALFFLRGMAIIRFLLDRWRMGLFGRALVWLLVLQMPVPVLVALGGLFDEFFDLRTRVGPAAGKGAQE